MTDLICPFCGEPEFLEIFEIYHSGEFQFATCCEATYEEMVFECQDADARRALVEYLEIEALTGKRVKRVPDVDGQFLLDYKLEIGPIKLAAAKEFVTEHHAHNRPPAGWRFGAGVWNGFQLIGVVMVGRPVARRLDHQTIVEANRVCVRRDLGAELVEHACSKLYAWAAREAGRRGFEKIISYTLESEPGTSLIAAGWQIEGRTRGGSWHRPSRPRSDRAPIAPKIRWARNLSSTDKEL